MLKNIRLAPKLIGIGGLLILIPILIVGFISVNRAQSSLKNAIDKELTARSQTFANLVDNWLVEQIKFTTSLSTSNDIVRISSKYNEKGAAETQEDLESLGSYYESIAKSKKFGAEIEVLALISLEGKTIAVSKRGFLYMSVSEKDYFKSAMSGKTSIGEAAFNNVTGKPAIPFSAPVRNSSGDIIAVFLYTADIGFLSAMAATEKIGETGNMSIIDHRGYVIGSPISQDLLAYKIDENPELAAIGKKMLSGETGIERFVVDNTSFTAGYAPVKSSGWSVKAAIPDQEYLTPVSGLRNFIIVFGMGAFFLALGIFFVFAFRLAKDIIKGVDFAEQIARGDLNATIDIDQKDEIGILANSMKNMAEKFRTAISDVSSVMDSVKNGDLSRQITADLSGDLTQLKESINESISMLSDTMAQVVSSSEEVNTGTMEVSASAQNLASGTTEQAASMEEIASSMSEIDSKTKTDDENAIQSRQLIQETLDVVEGGNHQMDAMLKSINQMQETGGNVTKIIKEIDEIAFQTNLLALNAAVEAARAGKYGKGFAVVAEEVRNLAARSAEAAKNTTELITSSVKETETGVVNATKTSETLMAINESIGKVNDIIKEIAVSSKEQRAAIAEINNGLMQVNKVIQSNSAISEETASSAAELSSQATGLKQLMLQFNLKEEEETEEQPAVLEIPDNSIEEEPQDFENEDSGLLQLPE